MISFSNGSEIKLYSSEQLAKFHHPPGPSISLARDFIHDSLYNPNYGYFFNQVEIFDRTSTPTDNNTSGSLEDELYAEYFNPKSGTPQNQLLIRRHHQSEEEGASSTTDQRQIWHTPTELFKPWYAWSMAHYILQKHLKEESVTQKKKLKIYEIGAGNGTLCVGILDYIRSHHPSIYTTMEYVTIEVSSRLAAKQRSKIDLNGTRIKQEFLPNSLPGSKGAPVVQTRYNGLTVPASTFLVKPGLFDIFFPTDFKGLTSLYHHLLKQHQSSSLVAEKRVEVINQNKFLLQLLNNSDLKSRIQAHHLGLDLNQIYSYYQNVKIFTVT
ncbi:hypothetical protein PSTT_07569 [Puccinia striiformis]|uniref:Protein arginine methyltransferase NDUFAF7 n=1 Tax=Puccinia striiformis TaxID=27350 RepID=A0A2S4VFP0_9BASI|nr:hypothetical protein PSTT_07569 [Puccinia striiformis]